MPRIKISAVLIVKNEEANIEKCLNSVSWADEIIVVDDYSSDKTLEIAQQFTAKIFRRNFDNFANQKNFALGKASNSWIFLIDADEMVDEELKNNLTNFIEEPGLDSYKINFRHYFGKKWLAHGGQYPSYVIRFFRNYLRYQFAVHEKISVEPARLGTLNGHITHLTYEDPKELFNKVKRYSLAEAEQIDKPPFWKFIVMPGYRFLKDYFLKLGFLDGKEGFILQIGLAYYDFLKFRKAFFERQKKSA